MAKTQWSSEKRVAQVAELSVTAASQWCRISPGQSRPGPIIPALLREWHGRI